MAAKSSDFDKIVQIYRDRYGVDLSHMRMKWSKHPVYIDGSRSYDFDDDETGGSWVDDGTVRINPNMGPVMKRFGIDGMTQAEFRRRLIAHELAHEVWHNQSRKAKVKRLIRGSLAKAREENFTTPYLDTYPPDTPKKKFDSELFAEYMSDQLNKKAQAYEPPWTIDQIRKNLGDEVADRLAKDPVHRWRSDTGIELVHREPTKEELKRIVRNWRLMSDEQKRLSDEKSRELFGVTNEENARRLLGGRRRETWESGEGEVESYTPDKTENHDEIVIRLDDGRRVRISNNTKLGKILKARVGSKVGYHGYRIDGTDVVHKVHPNRRSSGGWLERPRG